jgi:prolyl-tRNA editing enzyme YbaK/EbsC (Cys-tRNA(Pro) deacylase)
MMSTHQRNELPKAMVFLNERKIKYRLLPHHQEAKTVALAVLERGVKIEEMIKCILLKDTKNQYILACATGEAKLNIQSIRNYFKSYSRLSFASAEEIDIVLGYQQGSVAPFNLKNNIPIILDDKIKNNTNVNISSGDPTLGLELNLDDFLSCLQNLTFGSITNDKISH